MSRDDDLVIKPKPAGAEATVTINLTGAQVQEIHDQLAEPLRRRAALKRAEGGAVGYTTEMAAQAVALSTLAALVLLQLPDELREHVQQVVQDQLRRRAAQ